MLIVRTRTGTKAQPTTNARTTNIRFWSTTRDDSTTTHAGPMGVEIDLERVVHTDEDTFPSRTDGTFESERDKGKDPAF